MSAARLFDERMLTLPEAAGVLPGRPHLETVRRWAVHGLRRGDGSVVRLESARVGRARITSREALSRFVAAMNPENQAATAEVGPGDQGESRIGRMRDGLRRLGMAAGRSA